MNTEKIALAILLLITILQVIWLSKELKRLREYVGNLRRNAEFIIDRLQKENIKRTYTRRVQTRKPHKKTVK